MKVVELRGHRMRQEYDDGFVWATHDPIPDSYKRYDFIPKGIIAIANDYIDEADYFIWLAKQFKNLNGETYARKRSEINEKLRHGRRINFENYIVHKKNEGELAYVEFDGTGLRQNVDCDVSQGINDQAYKNYVPEGYYGVEKKLDSRDKPFTRFHESEERRFMLPPYNLPYDKAHRKAAAEEMNKRGGPYPGDNNYKSFGNYEGYLSRFAVSKR